MPVRTGGPAAVFARAPLHFRLITTVEWKQSDNIIHVPIPIPFRRDHHSHCSGRWRRAPEGRAGGARQEPGDSAPPCRHKFDQAHGKQEGPGVQLCVQ